MARRPRRFPTLEKIIPRPRPQVDQCGTGERCRDHFVAELGINIRVLGNPSQVLGGVTSHFPEFTEVRVESHGCFLLGRSSKPSLPGGRVGSEGAFISINSMQLTLQSTQPRTSRMIDQRGCAGLAPRPKIQCS